MAQTFNFIKRFSEVGIDDVPEVGGKNASLGEMYRELSDQGIRVPNGFAITAGAYRHFIRENGLEQAISDEIKALDPDDVTALAATGAKVRDMVLNAEIPADMAEEIAAAYAEMGEEYGTEPDVAVRSSATAEDMPDASFAGQQESILNVRGIEDLLQSCREVFASLFTNRAISYRAHQGYDKMDVALSIAVQKMVRSDLAASGVMFTLDTETGFRDVVFVTASYGLGENVVQGAVNPDEFYVFKPTLAQGHKPLVKRSLGTKLMRMVYNDDPDGGKVKQVDTSEEERNSFCITDEQVLELAEAAVIIEKHYSKHAGQDRPMDIEWGLDGQTGQLFILQARPETVESQKESGAVQARYTMDTRGEVLATGKSVGSKIAAGKARIIESAERMTDLQPGEVLVSDITDPDWEPVMKIASALVTNRGGRTCHAAIVARELGIPAIVGTGNGTELLTTGRDVTISCAEGDTGFVYDGILPYTKHETDLNALAKPNTKIMLNLANPSIAFETCKLPNSGVGLARLEFIINTHIRIHPQALLDYDNQDPELRAQIDPIIAGYNSPREFYVNRLAEGVATIAAAFYPNPVIARLSDFKSNEYAALIGGRRYEPEEENPMIGFRGAARYQAESFTEAFALECQAMKKVRDEMGLTNLRLMIPFVRTIDEQKRVLEILEGNGLKRGENDLKIVMMCEIPANAILADQFLENVDGFSIGSNDMTQLSLGVDRDSGLLKGYDERNEAVLELMNMAIKACHRADKYV
ncbi:MAG: phosphoenolpyruvate synthase, partial [Gammaproteobacteria bacterium]